MRRACVFRLRPTARQHVALAACVESHRELYNAALQERRDAWSHSKTRINYGDQSAQQARNLVARYDLLVVEDLHIANMLRRATPMPDPNNPGQYLANGARAKTGLSLSWACA